MNEEILPIRGHHLLCAPRFVGLGYSPEFTRSLEVVLSRLKEGSALALLVDGPDAICEACPHYSDDACQEGGVDAERRRGVQDIYVLGSLGVEVGDVVSWSQIEEMEPVMPLDMDFVCGACRWAETCWRSAAAD